MASEKVLILNADFRALGVCGVNKAFLLVYLGKAEMVSKSERGFLRTINKVYEKPSVIRLLTYIRMPYRSIMMSRQNIFKRDNNRCVYCRSEKHLTLDHVMPRSRGGGTIWQNLVTACKNCNSRKGNRTPEEARMPLPYPPFKPSFIVFLRDFSGISDKNWAEYLRTG